MGTCCTGKSNDVYISALEALTVTKTDPNRNLAEMQGEPLQYTFILHL